MTAIPMKNENSVMNTSIENAAEIASPAVPPLLPTMMIGNFHTQAITPAATGAVTTATPALIKTFRSDPFFIARR